MRVRQPLNRMGDVCRIRLERSLCVVSDGVVVAALMKRKQVVVDEERRDAKWMKMGGRGNAAAGQDQVGAAAQGPRRVLKLLNDASVVQLLFVEGRLICPPNRVGRFVYLFEVCAAAAGMMWQRRP
jgi:hypothetical protein